MLYSLFTTLLMMSASASGLYCLYKIMSRRTRLQFSARWHYYTGLLIISFFLIPYYEAFSWFAPYVPQVEGTILGEARAVSYEVLWKGLSILSYVWLIGFVGRLTWLAGMNVLLHRRLIMSCLEVDDPALLAILDDCKAELGISAKVRLYGSPYLGSPFLFGIFRPRIVIPSMDFTPPQWRQIFLHELTHYIRRDGAVKHMMLFVQTLHWFNPLVYIAKRDLDQLCELSCDENVVLRLNFSERKQYGELILSVLLRVIDQKNNVYSALSNQRYELQRRIQMILKVQSAQPPQTRYILAVAMLGLFMICGTWSASALSQAMPSEVKQGLQQDNAPAVLQMQAAPLSPDAPASNLEKREGVELIQAPVQYVIVLRDYGVSLSQFEESMHSMEHVIRAEKK